MFLSYLILAAATAGLILGPRWSTRFSGLPWCWPRLLLLIWLLVSLRAKASLAHHLLPFPVDPVWKAQLAEFGFFLGASSGLLLLPFRWSQAVTWLLAATGSFVLLGDVLYFRLSEDVLTISLIRGLGGMKDAWSSVQASLQPVDLCFVGDLPLALWVLGRMATPVEEKPRMRQAAAISCGATWLAVATIAVGFDAVPDGFRNRLQNRGQVEWHGLPFFHVYDAIFSLQPGTWPIPSLSDEVIRARLELSASSIGPEEPGYGICRGANLLIIQLESFESFPLGMVVSGQEITPCLNRLTQTSLWGAAVDQTAQARSADCEFLLLNSLHLPSRGPLCYHFQDTRFRAIPHLLAEQGYHTWKAMPFSSDYWNARVMSAAYGFESQYYDETFRIEKPSEKVGWSLSDSALFEDLLTLLTTMPEPFAGYVTTTMMHHPFRELTLEQEMLKLPQELRNTMLGDYLQLARFRDAAVGELVEKMKLEGLWETTVLVLCGDHRSRLPAEEYQRLSIPYGNRVLLLIHLPGDRLTGELPTPLGQLDVAPTLVQLFGLADSPRAFLGRNLLSPTRPVVTRTGLLRPPGEHLEAKALESDPAADPSGQWREELAISDHLIRGDRIKDHLRPDP